jgi:hypothetical protein
MLDDKTIKLFGDAVSFEYKLGLSPMNFDTKRGFLSHKGSNLQRLFFALNLLHLFGYMSFQGISLCFSLTGDKKPADVFWFLAYFCCYLFVLLTALDVWIHRATVAQAFNCAVNLAKIFNKKGKYNYLNLDLAHLHMLSILLLHLKETRKDSL